MAIQNAYNTLIHLLHVLNGATFKLLSLFQISVEIYRFGGFTNTMEKPGIVSCLQYIYLTSCYLHCFKYQPQYRYRGRYCVIEYKTQRYNNFIAFSIFRKTTVQYRVQINIVATILDAKLQLKLPKIS